MGTRFLITTVDSLLSYQNNIFSFEAENNDLPMTICGINIRNL